jgi:ribonuclease HI
MKTIIAGSRTVEALETVSRAIAESGFQITTVISGTAKGVDQLGEQWARANGIPVERFPADWKTHGNYAGHIRNRQMAENADALIAVWDGKSKGTKSMIEIAVGKGMPVHVHKVEHVPVVKIFTDGSCHPNPGPGGYAAIIVTGEGRREISQGFTRTTISRMELAGAIMALSTLQEKSRVTICSDSQYVVNAFKKGWIGKWVAMGWRTTEGKVKNVDLWKALLSFAEFHDVTFQWVKGHSGHPENERCDVLAKEARLGEGKLTDAGYEAILREAASRRPAGRVVWENIATVIMRDGVA